MKLLVVFAIIAIAYAADVKEKEDTAESAQNKDKRQTQGELVQGDYIYRTARKQEPVAPVEEDQDDDRVVTASSRAGAEEYRRGQVFSLNPQELIALQPERKAPLSNSQQLQQLYSPQQDLKQNLQPFYFVDPYSRQVTLQPSRTVIARPASSSSVGEASVGAALSVSDTGARQTGSTFDDELFALLGRAPGRQEDSRPQAYSPAPQTQQLSTQSIAPQYQQIDRYIAKPTKKPTKLVSKVQATPPQAASAPQQYLIETTNVAQQQPKPQQPQQYRFIQQPRQTQTLRYVPISAQAIPQSLPIQQIQQVQANPQLYYPESQNSGLKVVAAPKLQTPRTQVAYRFVPQYQQEISPKQYRLVEARPQAARQEPRVPASSIDRPVTYLKRFPEPEKVKSVKYYEQPEAAPVQRQPQIVNEQYIYRPLYRPATEQRVKYDFSNIGYAPENYVEPTKPPHSAIYVNKNIAPKKPTPQPQLLRIDEPLDSLEQTYQPIPQAARVEKVKIEKHGKSMEERRKQLPPPKNNRAYTPEEFDALVEAGYSVTPVPVSSFGSQAAQSRSSLEATSAPVYRHPQHNRRNQYLPLRTDIAP